MVMKNALCETVIEGYTSEGFGVGRIDGTAVFVPRAARGDRLLVRIVKAKAHYAYGKIEELITPSPYRIAPACPYFSLCGGCDFWHLTYEEELWLKKRRVEDAFARIASSCVTVHDILQAPAVSGYRNKALFPIGENGMMGLYRARSHDIVPISQCMLQSEPANRCLQAVSQYLSEAKPRGLRHLLVRVAEGTGNVLVCIIAGHDDLPRGDRLIALLREACPQITGIGVGKNTRRDNVILPEHFTPLWGSLLLEDVLCGLRFTLSPGSFMQVNHAQAQTLFACAAQYAGQARSCLDLYCGAGAIALVMAKNIPEVAGVEIHPPSVDNARQNAARNGMGHVTFFCGDAGSTDTGFCPEVITVDPPRRGLSPQTIDVLVRHNPRRLVYISCDPGTLARDTSILSKADFVLDGVTIVDMFPRTANVECVACLSRPANNT